MKNDGQESRNFIRVQPLNIFKTDVQSYYASIDHHRLLDLLAPQIAEPLIRNLIGQYLKRRGGGRDTSAF